MSRSPRSRTKKFFSILSAVLLSTLFIVSSGSAQGRKPLTLRELVFLIKDGVSHGRIVELIEKHGVDFEVHEGVLRKLKENGADSAILSATRKMGERTKEKQQRKKELEKVRKRIEVAKKEEEARRRELEEAKKREEEALRQAEEEAHSKKLEEAKKRDEARLQEEARKRELEEAERREEASRKSAPTASKPPVAPAPPCLVGLRLEFENDDQQRFTRTITGRESDLCVVGFSPRYYYNKDWVLVKVIEKDGQVLTSARPMRPYIELRPHIEQQWLSFPLWVGKTWDIRYSATHARGTGVGSFRDFFSVLAYEDIRVPAGRFKAFKIQRRQLQSPTSFGAMYFWYAPEVGYYVKRKRDPEESSRIYDWDKLRDYMLVSISHWK